MKIIDRNGRLFGVISIIDVLVVLVVLVMAAALYFKGQQTLTGTAVEEQTITFQIRARGLNDYVAGAILVGDGIFDRAYSSGGKAVGEIIDVQVEHDPGLLMADRLNDGTADMLEAEGTVDLLITVRGSGLITGKTYSINRVYALGVNSNRTYYTKHVDFAGTVAAILD